MFNSKAIKKVKESMAMNKDFKSMSKQALKSMAPKKESKDKEDKEEYSKKKTGPEASIEIELMLEGAKKKKK
jgi:hypothetical protein